MKKNIFYSLITFFLLAANLLAAQVPDPNEQLPIISTFAPAKGWYGTDVYIKGSGFTTEKENLIVKFGAVAAKIIESSIDRIRVQVPAGATYAPISVTYKPSGLTAYSRQPFLLTFGGKDNETPLFDPLVKLPTMTGVNLMDVCTCDLDGDGRPDLVGSNPNNTTITVYLNTSSPGTINLPVLPNRKEINAGKKSNFISCGDLDGDGKADLVLTINEDATQIIVLKNYSTAGANGGAGTISFPTYQLITVSTTNKIYLKPAIQDLNNDGKPEIILTNQTDNQVSVLKNSSVVGAINFDAAVSFPVTAGTTRGLRIKDLNNDGFADISASNYYGDKVYFFINNSSAGNISFQAATEFRVAAGLTNHELEDLDGDGKPDLLGLNYYLNRIQVYLNNSTDGSLSFSEAVMISTGLQPVGLELGDLNGDQKIDILVGLNTTAKANILTNTSTPGNLSFTFYELSSSETGKFANVQITDMDGDAKPDVVVAGNGSNNFFIYRNKTCIAPIIKETLSDGYITLSTVQSPPNADATASLDYEWILNPDGYVASIDNKIEDITPGNFTFTVKIVTADCGTLTSNPFSISNCREDLGNPVLAAAPQVCEGQPFTLSVSPATGGATYTWKNDLSGVTETTTSNTLTVAEADPALHSGTFTLTIDGSCSLSLQSGAVVVHPLPATTTIRASGELTMCSGESRILSVEQIYAGYQWKKDGVVIPSATTASHAASETGSYSVVVKNENGCEVELEAISLEVIGDLQAKFNNPGTACLNQPVQFISTSTLPSGAAAQYTWDFGDGTQSSEGSPVHTYTDASGSPYTVTLTIQQANSNCSSTFTSSITVSTVSDINIEAIGPTVFCGNDSVKVQVLGDISSVKWSNGGSGMFTYAKEGGTLVAEVVTTAGCSVTKSLELTTLPVPVLEVTTDKTVVGRGEFAQLQAFGGTSYTWEPAEGLDNPAIANPIASPNKTTTYKVTAVGENGCTEVAEITIDFDSSFRVQTPKLFIPNTDQNWIVSNIENFPEVSLLILNKLGRTVFEASPYENSWNGTENGNNLTEGVYFYVFKDASGNVIKTGSITLIR